MKTNAIKYIWMFATVMYTFVACGTKDNGNDTPNPYPNLERVTYEATDESFLNPERGWYNHNEFTFFRGSIPSPLSEAQVKQKRSLGYGLLLNIYYLQDFRDKDLSEDVLNVISSNMEAMRNGGMKCVLRFAYTNREDTEEQRPWDAPREQAARHIEQLKPILHEYGDIIYVMEAGFVGVWGEWYYTDNFVINPSTDADFVPRRELLDNLLDALPDDRMICVRTPAFKLRCFNITYADTITLATAHNKSTLSRIAGHNDCFLRDGSDMGTFRSQNDRAFWHSETKYTVMGGETCEKPSSYSVCSNAVPNMEAFHFSYLNRDYETKIINSWRTDACYNEIDRRLGYRLRLDAGYFAKQAAKGQPYEMVLQIYNEGFASPMNPRDAEIVFVEQGGAEAHKVALNVDPRFWFAARQHTVEAKLTLPDGLQPGKKYDMYLNLPDPKPLLAGRPEFSIRLANKNMWDENTGFNKIHTIEVE